MSNLASWLAAEEKSLVGWDFSQLDGQLTEEPLPWDYGEIMRAHLQPHDRLLDMGTGGGEFLLTLGHPPANTAVAEGYAPNLALCRQRLAPLGIRVEEAREDDSLPFDDNQFDVIINRHDSYEPAECYRCLKPGGWFITQQVGGENNRALSERLIPGFVPPYDGFNLEPTALRLTEAGFRVIRAQEAFPRLQFLSMEALIFFARAIPWEFPGFSVASMLPQLQALQEELESTGAINSREHRFLLVARKPTEP